MTLILDWIALVVCTNILQINPLGSMTIFGEGKRRKKMSFLSFPHAKTKTFLRHVVKCQWEIWNVNLKIKVSDELKSSIDLLLVSDCVYYEQSLQPLVKVTSEFTWIVTLFSKCPNCRWQLWQASPIQNLPSCSPTNRDQKKVFSFDSIQLWLFCLIWPNSPSTVWNLTWILDFLI